MSQQINLFNPLLQKRKNYLSAKTMAQAMLAVLLGAALLALYGNRQVAALERQVAAGKLELAKRQARQAEVMVAYAPRKKDQDIEQDIVQAGAERQSLLQLQSILARGEFGNTRGYSAYFRAFARTRVDGLWLTEVDILGAGNAIGLQGRVLSPALLPRYIGGLAGEPVLKGKTFARLELAPPAKPAGADAPVPAAPAAAAAGAATSATPAAPGFLEFSLQATPAEVAK
ncbi:Tfp pilus assembly protein PilN [Janthinobacterium sp. CG_23.3]|uniref:MSHA biogenesis protein MshA n=1 Tax=Janthinobacterium sp. CG_23.3 TaxID=3349634 RepID=UPI0038D3F5EF